MHPDLERLLDLQKRDLALAEVDARLKALLDEVASLDGELAKSRADGDEARKALQAGVKRREELEAKVESLRVLQERRRGRMDLAKTTREVAALTSELELARTVLMREEAEWFRTLEATSLLEERVAAADARLAEAGAGQGSAREVLGAKIAEVEAERSAAAGARELAARALGRPLLARYDRLRSGTQRGPVVVPLHGNACGNCYTAVPMSRRSHIRAGLLLDGCEACGVILYSATEAVEAT
jgi:predicted  nucleic acid-binding Zn-ribbon protein